MMVFSDGFGCGCRLELAARKKRVRYELFSLSWLASYRYSCARIFVHYADLPCGAELRIVLTSRSTTNPELVRDCMSIHIAPLTAADVEPVAALARIVWQSTYPGIITQAQIDFMLEQRYNPVRLLEELASPSIWWDKATVDGQLAAFSSCLLAETPGEMKLDKIYVDPARQRLGLGGRLIANASQRALAQGCRTLILAVNKRNERAIAAYQKYGFTVREAVCVNIGNDFVMDDFIMALPLR